MQDSSIVVIQQPDRQGTKPDGPVAIILWHQANGLAFECPAEVDHVALPLDLTVGTHLPHSRPDSVLWGGYPTRVGPSRRMVLAGGRLLCQCLMWPFGVVVQAKGVEGSLLPPPGCPWRTCRLCLQSTVQSLQSSVLLRVTWFDPLRHDAQLDPPYRQLRQATQAHTGKGWSVVGPNGRWKSILPKGALKHPSRFVVVRLPQPIADQQVSRGGVLHRQRVDPGPISRSEPPLEVDRPHVIGPFCRRKRLAPRRCMPSTFSTLHQPCSVKDLSRRARRRPRRVGLGIPKRRHHFLRSPVLPIHPLVSRLTAYTEPSAQRHEAHFPPLPPFHSFRSSSGLVCFQGNTLLLMGSGWARLTPITRSATAKGVLFGRRIGARLRSPTPSKP